MQEDDNSAASSAGTEEAVILSNTTEYHVDGAEFDFDDPLPTDTSETQDDADDAADSEVTATADDAEDSKDSDAEDTGDSEDDELDIEGLLGLSTTEEEEGGDGEEAEEEAEETRFDKHPRFQQLKRQRDEERIARETLEKELQELRTAQQQGTFTADREAFMDAEAERLTDELRAEDPDLETYSPKAFEELVQVRLQASLSKWDSTANERAEQKRIAEEAKTLYARQAELENDQKALWDSEVPKFRQELLEGRQGKTLLLSPVVTLDNGETVDFASLAAGIAAYQRMNGRNVSVEAAASDLETGLKALAERFYREGGRRAIKRLEKADNSPPVGSQRGRAGQAKRELSIDDIRDSFFPE